MGKKVNIWLDDATLRLWEKIPTGERSSIIKGAIQTNSNNEPTDRKAEMIKMKLVELERTHAKLAHMNMQREMIEEELMTLRSDGEMLNISKEDFWSLIEQRAVLYSQHKSVYHSYSGKSKYSIFDVTNDKIYIRNLRTGRNNSNFSKRTIDVAINRLIAHGGKIPVGQFIPVKMHEYATVALHPRLFEKEGYVCWIREKVTLVTEDMIPEHNHEMPPEAWVSNENFLAVLLDGKRALIGQGRKLVIFMKEKHVQFDDEIDNVENPWQTKHWLVIGPGMLYWGHEHQTQKMVSFPNASK